LLTLQGRHLQLAMAATLSALSAAAVQRGQSAVEAVQRHAEGLQAALDAHTQALTQQQNKFARLREDFNYNLQLLRQRDVALQEAAEANRAAAEALEERERLLSEVSARLDEASQRERVQREGREEDARRHAEALQRLKVCGRGRAMNAQQGTKQTHWLHTLKTASAGTVRLPPFMQMCRFVGVTTPTRVSGPSLTIITLLFVL
jgi:DNA repair exonuclease SbcCD ATPase subunit